MKQARERKTALLESESVSRLVVSDSLQPHEHYSLPGSFVPGILQARILEWIAIPFSKGSSQAGIKPGSPALQADPLPSEPPGKTWVYAWEGLFLRS